jgi:hypothetical protein
MKRVIVIMLTSLSSSVEAMFCDSVSLDSNANIVCSSIINEYQVGEKTILQRVNFIKGDKIEGTYSGYAADEGFRDSCSRLSNLCLKVNSQFPHTSAELVKTLQHFLESCKGAFNSGSARHKIGVHMLLEKVVLILDEHIDFRARIGKLTK